MWLKRNAVGTFRSWLNKIAHCTNIHRAIPGTSTGLMVPLKDALNTERVWVRWLQGISCLKSPRDSYYMANYSYSTTTSSSSSSSSNDHVGQPIHGHWPLTDFDGIYFVHAAFWRTSHGAAQRAALNTVVPFGVGKTLVYFWDGLILLGHPKGRTM